MNDLAAMIEKYGWVAHYVPLDDKHVNYHTHGVMENYNHPDFQITLPIDMESAHSIVTAIVDDVKEGKVFQEGMEYDDYIKLGYRIGFKMFCEMGEPVLRILFPDRVGFMPTDALCDSNFKYQLDEIEGAY